MRDHRGSQRVCGPSSCAEVLEPGAPAAPRSHGQPVEVFAVICPESSSSKAPSHYSTPARERARTPLRWSKSAAAIESSATDAAALKPETAFIRVTEVCLGEALAPSFFVTRFWLLYLQTQIEVPTSYADSGVYTFSRVFRASQSIEDVFHSTLPIVMDCALGVNGAILVRSLVLCWRVP